MHRLPPHTLLVALVVALAAAPAPAIAATPKPGTFSGTLGTSVPKGAQARVRAISRAAGTVTAVQTVGRKGTFRLSLPAGTYLVVGTIAPKRGKIVETRVGVSLKAGQRRTKATLNRRKNRRRKKARRSSARSAYVQERGQVTPGRVAVEIPPLKGTSRDPEWNAFRGGIDDLLITDVVQDARECGISVLEVEHRAEIIKELEFQQSIYVDPSTRVTRNFILGDVEVLGTTADVPGSPGDGLVNLRIVDKRTGAELGTLSQVVDGNAVFQSIEKLSAKLNEELCKLTDAYEVTLDLQSIGRFATHEGSGTLHTTVMARRGSDGGGKVWRASGTLIWGDLAFSSKTPPCVMVDPIAGSSPWSVTILDAGDGELQVTWLVDDVGTAGNSTASMDCPPEGDPPVDPPPQPGLPGASLLATEPASFTVPYAGGRQSLAGGVFSGGSGWTNSGTLTIRPNGVAKKR